MCGLKEEVISTLQGKLNIIDRLTLVCSVHIKAILAIDFFCQLGAVNCNQENDDLQKPIGHQHMVVSVIMDVFVGQEKNVTYIEQKCETPLHGSVR